MSEQKYQIYIFDPKFNHSVPITLPLNHTFDEVRDLLYRKHPEAFYPAADYFFSLENSIPDQSQTLQDAGVEENSILTVRMNADNKDKNYVVTENDSMQVVAKWLGSEAPKNLLSYLREKRILALGCKFDDWLFRFFWYLLKQDLALLKEGEVAISFDEKEDAKLINYLKRENIKSFGDARIFMCNALENIELVQGQLNNNRHKGGVFISYCNEDYAVAVNIFSRLTKEGYNVWLDKEQLHPGHEYDDKISNAIAECKVFMPILSTRVKNDLEEDLHRYYRDVEWKLAQDRYLEDKNLDSRSFFIVPVAVGLYDVRGEIHQKTPECIMRSTAYIVGKEEFWHLKEMLNDFLT